MHLPSERGFSGRVAVLATLRHVRRQIAPGSSPSEVAAGAESLGERGLGEELARCADVLREALAAQAPSRLLAACAAAFRRDVDGAGSGPALSLDAREAVDRALATIVAVLDDADLLPASATPDHASAASPDPSIAILFPAYRSLRHLAGAQRVHPAELWPGVSEDREIPADLSVAARPCDATVVADLEAALLRSLRQPDALAFARLSDLCAALGAAESSPTSRVWRLASAVFEAQRERLLEPDVYLKRLGSQLLSLARAAVAAPAERGVTAFVDPDRLATLAHELWFFGVHAATPASPGGGSRLAALRASLPNRKDAQPVADGPPATGEPASPPVMLQAPSAQVPRLGPRSLVEAVPGLPSIEDLDLDDPIDDPAGEAVKVIGPLRIEIERFNRFLVEADELSRQLGATLGEWSVAAAGPLGQEAVALAQAMAVEAAAVGHAELAQLSALTARAMTQSAVCPGFDSRDAELFLGAHGEASRLLHSFAAGFLKSPEDRWVVALRVRAGEETARDAALPASIQSLARQADAAQGRIADALTALRKRVDDVPGAPFGREALDAIERDAQTLAALFEDLCEHWPADALRLPPDSHPMGD